MTVSAWSGPAVVFGVEPNSAESNPDRGPSPLDQGMALMDPRAPFHYAGNGNIYGWLGSDRIPTLSVVPSALAVNNIAASQTPTAGVALTLVSSTAAGITVGVSITRADTGATVTGLLAVDGAGGAVAFGQGGDGAGGPVRIWDPTKCISRCIRIVSASDDSSGTFTVNGYDIYGYPLTATVTGASGAPGTATTLKAFKYIASIMPAGTLGGGAVTVGTTDTIGLPLRADYFGEIQVYWNTALVTATTGFTGAVTTSPSTALIGDVRGTYALQTAASNGTLRLMVYQSPSVANISSTTGLVGVTQV